jgi:4-hydroxy-2-oxoheptanedioate aldolase
MECLGRTGLDFVIIDNEHGPFDTETTLDFIRAAELGGICPFVRVKEISRPAVLKMLDVGAQGLIVPNVHTVEEVHELVGYAKYAPVGNRGFCPTRKDCWGFDYPATEGLEVNMAYHNRETLLIPQCETVGALAQIEEIAAIPGVDGIFIGPFDLSISMGIPGQFKNPEFLSALSRILKACKASGKFCILFTMSPDAVADGFGQGYDAMAFSLDAYLFTAAVKAQIQKIRETI